MKKFFLILTAFVCAMSLQAETTRIYCKMTHDWWKSDAAAVGAYAWRGDGDAAVRNADWPGQRMSAVFGEADLWYVDLDLTQFKKIIFTRVNGSGNLEYWGAKTGDRVIPTDGKNLFTISTENACWNEQECTCDGHWSVYEAPIEDPSYYLAGEGFPGVSWDAGSHLLLTDGTITFTGLAAGTYKFKITNGTWSYSMGIGGVNASCSTPGAYSGDNDGNVVIRLDGEGDITISVVEGKICVTVVGNIHIPGGNGVPSQCEAVSMQGFYWNSYMRNDSATATNLYGDTRWKTLLEQSNEIGAYFDIIWLPPSGLASGTGYYPRQYSVQNSAWGSRAELEKLIASFHNSGMKVIADVVLDHMIAMNGWCDFATMDFGKYGTFTPDMSWVCNGDEVNWDKNHADTLAGPCWGLATGPDDEGDNNDGARDLAHAKKEVQDFSKAYLQWLRDEMKYDGFRWDEAKGFDPIHIGEYNEVAEPYISFVERWSGNSDIAWTIARSDYRTMALDFMTKYKAFDGIARHYYGGCRVNWNEEDKPWDNSGLLGCGWSKYAVTFIDSHDWFLRNNQEFGGGNSMSEDMKPRLLQANAYLLSMPGVPSVFYPHWAKYKEDIKPMINARHLAGIHSESVVREEEVEDGGYKATIVGKNGLLILMLGNKTTHSATGAYQWLADYHYQLVAKGPGYAMWVLPTGDVAPGIIVNPGNTAFEDSIAGINVTIEAVGGSGNAVIYYTTDGTNPTMESAVYSDTLNFKTTTTLKVMAVCGTAQSRVQEYTYTYREPLQHGIRVRFNKPEEWNKAYIFAWKPYKDENGEDASVNLMGAYPGKRMYQEADGWFMYEFDADLDKVNFCINSGNDCGDLNIRSNDLEADYDMCLGWQAGKEEEAGMEEQLDCEEELNPGFDLAIVPESGFFRNPTEGQEVTIRTIGNENAQIYYTTDGAEPTSGSTVGMGEVTFTVNQTTTVKAYAQIPGGERTPTYSATYTYKAPQEGVITVRFIKPEDWTDLYLYAFTRVMKSTSQYDDTPYSLDGNKADWPGMKWTSMDDAGKWYVHTMREVIPEGVDFYIIFNAGMNKAQSQDIFITENTCYLWSENCYRAVVDEDCDGIGEEGLEQIIDNSNKNHETYKLIIEGRLVIVHNGAMYDVFGRKL